MKLIVDAIMNFVIGFALGLLIIIGASKCAQASTMYVYLTPTNTVTFRGEVTDEAVQNLENKIWSLHKARQSIKVPLYLVLDSPGGSIGAGQDFIEFAKMIPNLHTITIFSASMAAGIVEALPGKRYITDTGTLMFHRARGGVEGQFETGEMESRLNYFKSIVRGMEVVNASRMSMSLTAYKASVKDEMWLYGSQAVASKGSDATVSIMCSDELMEQKESALLRFFIFEVKVTYSGCPLQRSPSVSKGEEKAYNKYKKAIQDSEDGAHKQWLRL